MAKFKVGDKVRLVDQSDGTIAGPIHEGNNYADHINQDLLILGAEEGPLGLIELQAVADGRRFGCYAWRLELIEPAEPVGPFSIYGSNGFVHSQKIETWAKALRAVQAAARNRPGAVFTISNTLPPMIYSAKQEPPTPGELIETRL